MNTENSLYEAAQKAADNAYAPYSQFKVGCAVLSTKGNIYSGCNVENVSYPVGTCAEAGAVAAMICGGDNQIAAALVYADTPKLITPCGACRQRFAEFAAPNAIIYLADATGIRQKIPLADILPYAFKEL